jgi:hypothetical protein
MSKERIVTVLIILEPFGDLVGGPIASLVDYQLTALLQFLRDCHSEC